MKRDTEWDVFAKIYVAVEYALSEWRGEPKFGLPRNAAQARAILDRKVIPAKYLKPREGIAA